MVLFNDNNPGTYMHTLIITQHATFSLFELQSVGHVMWLTRTLCVCAAAVTHPRWCESGSIDDLSLRSACWELWEAAELQDLQYTQIRLHLFKAPEESTSEGIYCFTATQVRERRRVSSNVKVNHPDGICCDEWMNAWIEMLYYVMKCVWFP